MLRRARLTVLAVVVGFVFQLGYLKIAEEPYPALMMPRFTFAGSPQGRVDIVGPEILFSYADGTTKIVTQRALLSHVPEGHHSVIMWNVLSPLPDETPTRHAPEGKYEPPHWLFPGYNLARVTRTQSNHQASLREWLRHRAGTFYSGATATRCTVAWHVEKFEGDFDPSRTETAGIRESMGTFTMELDATSEAL